MPSVQSLRILLTEQFVQFWFPADYLHPTHCDWLHSQPSSVGYSDFPAYSQVLLRLRVSDTNVNLRTVIVTAAVYRGFGRELLPEGITRFLNLPAPGRRQTLYIHLRVSRVLCF